MNVHAIINALLDAKNEKQLNKVIRDYHDEIMNHPGLKDLLKSTIKRITTVNDMRRKYENAWQ